MVRPVVSIVTREHFLGCLIGVWSRVLDHFGLFPRLLHGETCRNSRFNTDVAGHALGVEVSTL